MELALNLAWAVLAVILLVLQKRHALREGRYLRAHLVARLLILLILFPVISVTDDLQLAQNPAEAENYGMCARWDHASPSHHVDFLAAAMPLPGFVPHLMWHSGILLPEHSTVRFRENPALNSIESRPPPAA
jgi:hypothetical protein